MNQKIIHCSDAEKLPNQLIKAGYFNSDFGIKTPCLPVKEQGVTITSNNQSLICVLINEDQEASVNSIKCLSILGTYEEIFADSDKLKIYDSIYDRSEKIITGEKGEEIKYTPPDKFAEFALPAPDPSEEYETAHAYRVKMLYETDWIAQRQMEQQTAGSPQKMAGEEFNEVLTWRQELRDMFNSPATFRSYVASMPSFTWPPMPDVIKQKFPDYPPK